MKSVKKPYITRESDYAIRLVAYLGSKSELSHTSDIAEKLKIGRPFLVRIINKLALNGIIISKKGRRGGIKLKRSASDISLYDVLTAVDGYKHMNICSDSPNSCSMYRICKISPILWNIELNFRKQLKDLAMDKLIFEDKGLDELS